jgi:NAD(P)-dependent dehydrogenase (short-subunit alcohol dehydrogenase family)
VADSAAAALGGTCAQRKLDAARPQLSVAAVDQAAAAFGRLDIVVSNARIASPGLAGGADHA